MAITSKKCEKQNENIIYRTRTAHDNKITIPTLIRSMENIPPKTVVKIIYNATEHTIKIERAEEEYQNVK